MRGPPAERRSASGTAPIVSALGSQPRTASRQASAGVSAVLDVLEALDRDGPMTLAELSRATGVAKSTLHRVCRVMAARRWVARNPEDRLGLGPRIAWLSRTAPASVLTAAFGNVARELVAAHKQT